MIRLFLSLISDLEEKVSPSKCFRKSSLNYSSQKGQRVFFFEDELATLVAEGVVAGADVEVGVELGFAELAEGFG